jgi:hypothetical protein
MSNESYLLLITLPVGEFNLRFSPCEKCGLSPPLLSSGKFYVGVKIPRRSFLANASLRDATRTLMQNLITNYELRITNYLILAINGIDLCVT